MKALAVFGSGAMIIGALSLIGYGWHYVNASGANAQPLSPPQSQSQAQSQAQSQTGHPASTNVVAAAPTQPPQSPASIVVAGFSANDAMISWSRSANASEYVLYRGITPRFSQAKVIARTQNTLYHDTGLYALTTYYYWVGAQNSSGTAAPQKSVSFETYDTWGDVEQRYKNSVVRIETYTSVLGALGRGKSGTGWLAMNGDIVTNYHVIANWNYVIDVFSQSGQKYHAQIVSVDKVHDLALLKVPGFPAGARLPVSSIPLAVGDTVAVYGRPGGEQLTLTTGKILGLNQHAHVYGDGIDLHFTDLALTDAPSVFGNSGSPVFNHHGQVVGVMESGSATSGNHGYLVLAKYLEQWGI